MQVFAGQRCRRPQRNTLPFDAVGCRLVQVGRVEPLAHGTLRIWFSIAKVSPGRQGGYQVAITVG
jgi:hypothetical protein